MRNSHQAEIAMILHTGTPPDDPVKSGPGLGKKAGSPKDPGKAEQD